MKKTTSTDLPPKETFLRPKREQERWQSAPLPLRSRAAGDRKALQATIEHLRQQLHEANHRAEKAEAELKRSRGCAEEQTAPACDDLLRQTEELRREIKKRKQDKELIQEQNAFLNHVLESLTHPFYVLDANDYTIKMANSAAINGELMPGMTCYALTHRRDTPCDGSEHGCPLQLIKETKKPVTLEHIHFDKEGNPRHVEVHGYPIFDSEGKVIQMLEYSLDITERKQLEQQLRDNAEKIKHFAYAVSHDLKSPMVGILGLIRLLHKRYGQDLDPKGMRICDQILKGVEQMAVLVEEINSYIKAKETIFHFERLDPLEIIHTVRDEFAPLLSLRGISWTEPASLPPMTMDRMSMIRIFRNLVDNAVKYGGEEMTEITFAYREEADCHLISVSDDGVGIKKEDSEKIFELFQRNETARGVEGTGLGLAIVREIVQKHHGKVWVESAPGKGTTFALSLPKEQEG